MIRDEAAPEWLPWKDEAQGAWLRLHDGIWINMGSVRAVRPQPGGWFVLEFTGQHNHAADSCVTARDARDIALIAAYLARAQFLPGGIESTGALPPGASDIASMAQPCEPPGPQS